MSAATVRRSLLGLTLTAVAGWSLRRAYHAGASEKVILAHLIVAAFGLIAVAPDVFLVPLKGLAAIVAPFVPRVSIGAKAPAQKADGEEGG